MHKSKIEELREKRAGLYEGMKEVLARQTEEGLLSAEDAQEFDAREAEFDRVSAEVARLEKFDGIAPTLRQAEVSAEEAREVWGEVEKKREESRGGVESDEYRSAFSAYLRQGETLGGEQRAALNVGTSAQGGYTVAQEWHRQLIEAARDFGVIEQLATHIRTADSGQLHVPALNTRGTAALTAEAAAFTESEDTFTERVLDSYKIGTLVLISDELRHDSIFDLDSFIANAAGQAIGIKANNYFVVGTGSSQPNGITVAASTGKTAASATAVTAAELIDLQHSLLTAYRRNASWIMKDATVAAIRKLTNSGTGEFAWQPSLQAGKPDLLFGNPVYADPDMPAQTTGLKSIVYGDISKYWVREVGNATVKVLTELYAANGQVGYRVDRRLDGELIDTSAVKVLAQA